MEYVFINDCTPDNSMLVLERVLEEYPHRKEQVRIFSHERNLGSGEARKAGMKAAKGRYIIFCDGDDWTETDMYEKMYTKAIKEDADVVCCDCRWEYKQGIEVYEGTMDRGKKSIRSTEWDVLSPCLWNKLVRRNLYVDRHIYPYEGINMWEDRGMTTRLCFLSKKTVFIHECLYHYNRQNPSSYTSRERKQSFAKERIKCAQELDVFFRDQGAYTAYNVSIQSLKFHAKLSLLRYGLYQEWLHTFPETHRYIWKFPTAPFSLMAFRWQSKTRVFIRDVPFFRKFLYFLAIHGISFLYDLRQWELQLFERIGVKNRQNKTI
jgi:glycosyltransferase involved in cell wall biosynthesis